MIGQDEERKLEGQVSGTVFLKAESYSLGERGRGEK
jgi:hypothetical protein